ncbi:MAG: NADH-quinone oxidoreductase subunit I [Coriobacteriales bacterium]|nr:NADH-quinone oxidoreductase subunit I [Coriobacteriales bacterium]
MSIWGTGIVKGLGITIRNMFRKPITVQYPHEKLELPERARWTVEPSYDGEGNIKCTGCLTCVRVCPDHVLDMKLTVGEDKSKHIDYFRYECGACMMCGLCTEACPFDAIHMSHDYELARTSADELTYNLLEDIDAARPARKAAEPKPKPAGGADEKPDGAPAAEATETAPAPDTEAKEAQDA